MTGKPSRQSFTSCLSLSFCLIILLSYLPVSPVFGSEPTTFKLAHCCSTTGPYNIAAEKFAQLVLQYSGDRLKAHIFSNHQLGNEREIIEGIFSGMIQAGIITNAPFGSYQPKTMCLDLPFIFKDYAHAHRVLDGPVGKSILDSLKEIGIKGLAFAEGGFRNIITKNILVKNPEDLLRVKFRVMETPLYVATFRALGADPVPMAWGNVHRSFKEGIINALEIPIPVMFENKFYEIGKYITLTQHTYSPLIIVVNMKWYNSLHKDMKVTLEKSAREAADYERMIIEKREVSYLEKLRQKGMTIKRLPNVESWKKKVAPVYKQYERIVGKELIDEIVSK